MRDTRVGISGGGSSSIAGNSILPTRSRKSSLSTVECLGASLDAASTVTCDHLGEGSMSDARGVQRSVVDGAGSVEGSWGVNWRKTKGDRIMRSRFPREVVISLSSSWPMHV